MADIIVGGVNIIEKEDKLLLIQEKSEKVKGKWNLPGGALNIDEDIIECAKREGEEETGFKIELSYLVGVYNQLVHSKRGNLVLFIFKSDTSGGKLTHNKEEVLDIKWFSFEEIEDLNEKKLLAFPCIIKSIRDYRKGRRISLDSISAFS